MTFTETGSVRKHMGMHIGQIPYKLVHHDEILHSYLIIHMRTQADIKAYKCDKQSSELTSHEAQTDGCLMKRVRTQDTYWCKMCLLHCDKNCKLV